MMRQIKVLGWMLEVDKEATEAAYEKSPSVPEECGCIECRNFLIAWHTMPSEFLSILSLLGVAPRKPADLYGLSDIGTDPHYYACFYHVIGKMISGEDWRDTQGKLPRVVENFEFGFTGEIFCLPEAFPLTVVQLEFIGPIRWMVKDAPV